MWTAPRETTAAPSPNEVLLFGDTPSSMCNTCFCPGLRPLPIIPWMSKALPGTFSGVCSLGLWRTFQPRRCEGSFAAFEVAVDVLSDAHVHPSGRRRRVAHVILMIVALCTGRLQVTCAVEGESARDSSDGSPTYFLSCAVCFFSVGGRPVCSRPGVLSRFASWDHTVKPSRRSGAASAEKAGFGTPPWPGPPLDRPVLGRRVQQL